MQQCKSERMIESLGEEMNGVVKVAAALQNESRIIRQQWETMGKLTGHRPDDAAYLMKNLLVLLDTLRRISQRCHNEIESVQRDPFQE